MRVLLVAAVVPWLAPTAPCAAADDPPASQTPAPTAEIDLKNCASVHKAFEQAATRSRELIWAHINCLNNKDKLPPPPANPLVKNNPPLGDNPPVDYFAIMPNDWAKNRI